MTFEPVQRLRVFYVPHPKRRRSVGTLIQVRGELLFEWDEAFLQSGLELSPLRLPARRGVVRAPAEPFEGLPGVFADSLPDGWGRLLQERRAQSAGLPPGRLGPLDRLALVGRLGMGALTYEPELGIEPPSVVDLPRLEVEVARVLDGRRSGELEELLALGGSPQGARPKVLAQVSGDDLVVIGDAAPRAGFTPVLVKFRSKDDDDHAGTLEHAYVRMAHAAGVDVPRTWMLGRSRRHPGFFAIERFDRVGDTRVHLHTFAGLVHARHDAPSVGYRELLQTTLTLTRDQAAVTEVFRRACFNVFAHNRDDHAKNHSFLMNERGRWTPSPAYDLTFSRGPGGEHALAIGNEGASPGVEQLQALGDEFGVRRVASLISDVAAAVREFESFAADAGVPRGLARRVAAALPVPRLRKRLSR